MNKHKHDEFLKRNHRLMTMKEMVRELNKQGSCVKYGTLWSACRRLRIKPKHGNEDEEPVAKILPAAIYSNQNSYLTTMQKYS